MSPARDSSLGELTVPRREDELVVLDLLRPRQGEGRQERVGGTAPRPMLLWPVSTIFLIVSGLDAPETWYWGTVAALTLAFWATLYTLAVRETAADRAVRGSALDG